MKLTEVPCEFAKQMEEATGRKTLAFFELGANNYWIADDGVCASVAITDKKTLDQLVISKDNFLKVTEILKNL